jgi:translation initiation factor IF-3
LFRASKHNLDLVEVAPNASPPVCKIMDYGKYRFQQSKKHARQKTISLKEIKVRPRIGDNDLEMKIRNINRFIKDGDRVKITMFFKGREIVHASFADKVFNKIKAELVDNAQIETEPRREGNRITMIVVPKGG